MGRSLVLALIMTFSLMLLGLVRSEYLPWPDAVHTNYGFPLFWLTHQSVAISGPVNFWFFSFVDFAIGIIFWFCIALLILWIFKKIRPTI